MPQIVPPGCAVYAAHADPAVSAREFSAIVAALPAPLGRGDVLPDQTPGRGPFGARTLRVGMGFDDACKDPHQQVRSTLMVMTDERPGNATQITMQMSRRV